MSIVKLPLLFVGSKGEKKLHTLFDPAVNYSLINARHIIELACVQKMTRTKCLVVSGSQQEIKASHVAILDFYINDVAVSDEFLVTPDISDDVIIGTLTIRKWRMKIDPASNSAYVDPKVMVMSIGRIIA